MALTDALRAHIRSIVDGAPVVLFMKGTRVSPACGFSGAAVAILDGLLPAYHTVDILADPSLREGLKDFSEWPTFPQLYARGEFVGGSDIIKELHGRGELRGVLGVAEGAVAPPTITVSAAAAEVFRQAASDAPDLVLRLEVSSGFSYDLYFGDPAEGDVVAELGGGLVMRLDAASAHRADGATIDYVVGSKGAGFAIKSPREPAKVRSLSVADYAALRAAGRPHELVDVRTEEEWDTARIEGARLLDAAYEHELLAMDRGAALVFQCHHGIRSRHAAEHFLSKGFYEVFNLEGGIEAWSTQVDPSVARY